MGRNAFVGAVLGFCTYGGIDRWHNHFCFGHHHCCEEDGDEGHRGYGGSSSADFRGQVQEEREARCSFFLGEEDKEGSSSVPAVGLVLQGEAAPLGSFEGRQRPHAFFEGSEHEAHKEVVQRRLRYRLGRRGREGGASCDLPDILGAEPAREPGLVGVQNDRVGGRVQVQELVQQPRYFVGYRFGERLNVLVRELAFLVHGEKMIRAFAAAFFLLLVPFVAAVPPGQSNVADLGLSISYPKIDYLGVGKNVTLTFHVFNNTGHLIYDNVNCSVHVYNRSGSHVLEVNLSRDNNLVDFYFKLNRSQTKEPGYIPYIVECWTLGGDLQGGFHSGVFAVGSEGDRGERDYDGVVLSLGVVSVALFVSGLLLMRWSKTYEDRETKS